MSIGSITPWNFGALVRSRNFHYLLHSVSVPEKDPICSNLWGDHSEEMDVMEGNIFIIDGKKVTIEFQPSADQAWQMYIAGELNSAATHPSPYAHNLHKSELGCMNESIGHKETDKWHPPTEKSRTRDLKLLTDFRATLSKDLSEQVQHTRELDFMAKNTIRQFTEPIIGMRYASLLRPEPLHMEINAHEHLLNLIYQEADKRNKMEEFLNALSTGIGAGGCGLKSVALSVREHYDDEATRSNMLTTRLIGEQAIKLANYGYRLADLFCVECGNGALYFKYLVICKLVEILRNIGSLISRVTVNQNYPSDVHKLCTLYHNLISLFFAERCNVTVWNIGYALPYHVQLLYEKYEIGYGITSMQGKESKHSGIKKMLKSETNQSNDNVTGKWMQIHKLCYLKDFHMPKFNYYSHSTSRIPVFTDNEPRCECSRIQTDGFSCNVCDSAQGLVDNAINAFIDPEVVKIVKPYLCKQCQKRFADLTLFNKHIRVHDSSKAQPNSSTTKERINVKNCSVIQLQQYLKERYLETTGTKAIMQTRLEQHLRMNEY